MDWHVWRLYRHGCQTGRAEMQATPQGPASVYLWMETDLMEA